MIEPPSNDDEGQLEELTAQLEEGHSVKWNLDFTDADAHLPPGTYDLQLTDVKFEDGFINVSLQLS